METPNNKSSIVNRPVVTPLMTCRYCLLFEMGHCRKTNPLTSEPKYLRLQNGTTVRLHFDCKNCQMLIYRD